MKIFFRRLVCFTSAFTFCFVNAVFAVTAKQIPQNAYTNVSTHYENGTEIQIRQTQPSQNIYICCEYRNGILTQRNTANTTTGEITKETFDNQTIKKETFKASDFVSVSKSNYEPNLFSANSSIELGGLRTKYSSNIPVNFKCSYQYIPYGSTTYNVYQKQEKILDLLSALLALGINIPATSLLKALISAGYSIIDGKIINGFVGTIAATRTDYVFKAIDIENGNYTRSFKSSKYIITEVGNKHLNEVYYEGGGSDVNPDFWRQTKLADALMFHFYDCSNYTLVQWY